MERHNFRIVWGESPETLWKLCLSTKFQTRKLGEIMVFYSVSNESYASIHQKNLRILATEISMAITNNSAKFMYYDFTSKDTPYELQRGHPLRLPLACTTYYSTTHLV